MTIETDCDNPLVVSLTKFNHYYNGFFEASGEAKASLKKASHAGETKGCLFRRPFFHALILSSFFAST